MLFIYYYNYYFVYKTNLLLNLVNFYQSTYLQNKKNTKKHQFKLVHQIYIKMHYCIIIDYIKIINLNNYCTFLIYRYYNFILPFCIVLKIK